MHLDSMQGTIGNEEVSSASCSTLKFDTCRFAFLQSLSSKELYAKNGCLLALCTKKWQIIVIPRWYKCRHDSAAPVLHGVDRHGGPGNILWLHAVPGWELACK